jgi:hypothetical protein
MRRGFGRSPFGTTRTARRHTVTRRRGGRDGGVREKLAAGVGGRAAVTAARWLRSYRAETKRNASRCAAAGSKQQKVIAKLEGRGAPFLIFQIRD